MAEKQERPSTRDFHSCSSKLVCPVSLVSLLICTAALVRVEIINQRIHNVEDLLGDARQNQNLIKVSTHAASFKRPERVESDGEFDFKIIQDKKDVTQVHTGKIRRSSSKAGTNPDELTIESVRSEINKTITSLTSRPFYSPKQQICVQGPPGAKGDQGIMGPPGEKGKQGIMGETGSKGNQEVMGSPGPKGNQGFMGPPGPKGKQGTMGPKGEQGIIGLPGPRGILGAKGEPGDSFTPPTMVIFPRKQTIVEKHNAVFQCTVVGNPKPIITWLGKSSSPLRSQDGRLELGQVNFDDAEEYTCIGRISLGITSQTAI